MNVSDVMTRDVITVAPEASIHTAARLMVNHAVSGLPVIDGDRLVGIISEGDLILRQKPRPQVGWWARFFSDGEALAREYQKAVGTTVGEVMSREVVTVGPEAPLATAAALIDRHKVRRLPVVAAGALLGIVSRGDLVKALASAPARPDTPPADAQLVSEMKRRLAAEPWVSTSNIAVEAVGGALLLWGLVESQAERSAVETMARAIPGCRRVENQLIIRRELMSRHGAA